MQLTDGLTDSFKSRVWPKVLPEFLDSLLEIQLNAAKLPLPNRQTLIPGLVIAYAQKVEIYLISFSHQFRSSH